MFTDSTRVGFGTKFGRARNHVQWSESDGAVMVDSHAKRDEVPAHGGEVGRLIAIVAEHYVIDGSAYPKLSNSDDHDRQVFGVRHCALHLTKLAGQIAALSEKADHTDSIDLADVKNIASKALINALKLAELSGMSDAELVKSVERRYGIVPRDEVKRAV